MTHTKATQGRAPVGAAPDLRAADGVAQGELHAHLAPDRKAVSMVLDSADMMPPIHAPWIDRLPFDHWVNSATFRHDDPEGLRKEGPKAVASALAGLAEWGQAAGRKDVREIAALIREWLIEDAGKHDTLDRDLGLSPRDGSRPLSNIARRAERDELVILLSRETPYAQMSARRAARELREACTAYETRRWPVDRAERKSRPQGEAGVWWQVMKLGLPYAMPGEETLKLVIEIDRAAIR
ncbi:hypothetical protein D2N39_13035 [Gemmobacter lutimaris]|uniref:Uncharacterized protein n=1 Tax=Gemmobacter lutimaris TaxID=2306023 RepID=A0A398BM85_9RHOB|nr:hypothetical protein [Gemmobacter lutimaris]RID91615.1 hypothetical protein D2N39_13035 [Gemmobacter lutimaris]